MVRASLLFFIVLLAVIGGAYSYALADDALVDEQAPPAPSDEVILDDVVPGVVPEVLVEEGDPQAEPAGESVVEEVLPEEEAVVPEAQTISALSASSFVGDVLVSQEDDSTLATLLGFPPQYLDTPQTLGNGLSGTIEHLYIKGDFDPGPFSAIYGTTGVTGAYLHYCDDENYSVNCSYVGSALYTFTPGVQLADYDFSSLGAEFDSSKYYFFYVEGAWGFTSKRIVLYGSSDPDSYPNGEVDRNMASAGAPVPAFPSGLADLYFVITGESANPEPTCCSSVLFLPGIEGSALKEGDNVLWPPNFWSQDVARLELTDVGESVNDIKVVGVLGNFYPGTNLYGGFASFMDELATVDSETGTSTIEAWVPFAYDWRYSPGKILEEGVSTPDGVVDLVATVEALAENSKSEKVTIVAHSMGGLLGKALIKELQDQGKEGLIDAFVMVGTPQLGTPQGVATLLHGDQPIALEFFVRSHALRAVAQNMQSAYDLLPSESYFEDIVSPVVSFDPNASFTQAWRDLWLGSLDTYDEFREFLTGVGVVRVHPEITNLGDPEVLDPVLLSASRTLHNELDDYEIPTNVRVVQVAGWGLPTIKTVMYWNTHLLFLPIPLRGYKGVPTVEGDDTVVYPSAVSLSTKASHFFNLASFNAQENTPDYTHKDLLNADQVQQIVEAVVRGTEVTETTYVRDERPDVSLVPEQLLIITRSPVILGVRDGAGHFTGIDSEQDLNSETLLITKDIPGSSVLISGEDQYIFLPKEGTYTFEFKGTGTGPATVETATFSNDTVVPIATYTDIPVTPDTEATFTVDTNVPEETFIQVDTNGNGVITPVPPDGYVFPPTLGELIASLKLKIQSLDVKQKLKDKLLKKVEKLEKKIAKNKLQRASKVVMNLEAKVIKKVGKGKISDADAQDILDLLDAIENAL